MNQVLVIALNVTIFALSLGLIGANVRIWWRTLPTMALPMVGLLLFGGVLVPFIYLLGHWSQWVALVLFGTFILSGVIVTIKLHPYRQKKIHLLSIVWAIASCLFILVAGWSTSKFAVLGGIDSAIHSVVISQLESGNLNIQYPLGMHMLISVIDQISPVGRAILMQSIGIFLHWMAITMVCLIMYQHTKTVIAGIIGIIAATLDVSLYNNFLNGSLTHLLGINLILAGIYIQTFWQAPSSRSTAIGWSIIHTAIVYFHFLSWYFFLPAYWVGRLIRKDRGWVHSLSVCIALIVTLPLIFKIKSFNGYLEVFFLVTGVIIVFELSLNFLRRWRLKISKKFITLTWWVVTGITTWLFLEYGANSYDNAWQWYGASIVILGLLGNIAITIYKEYRWLPIQVTLFVLTIGTVLFSQTSFFQNVTLVKELIFYYGFTVLFILLTSWLLWRITYKNIPRINSQLILTFLFLWASLVYISRTTDSILIHPTQAISRYGLNRGFGIFFSLDDVRLAEWANKNLPKDSTIANLGGRFGVWTSLTGRKLLFSVADQTGAIETDKTWLIMKSLLTDGASREDGFLRQQGIRYIFIPEAFKLYVQHPQLKLIRQIGQARLYEITSSITGYSMRTLFGFVHGLYADAMLSGKYILRTTHHGHSDFYQFSELAQYVELPEGRTLRIDLKPLPSNRKIKLRLNTSTGNVIIKLDGKVVELRVEGSDFVTDDFVQYPMSAMGFSIENNTKKAVIINTLAVEIQAVDQE